MKYLLHDFETFSEESLLHAGVSRYARHPSTEVLMLSWAVERGPIKQWVPAEGEPFPDELWDTMQDPEVIFTAWNSAFERMIWLHVLGVEIPISRWRCSMVLGHTLSFPGSLEKVGAILGVPEDKKKTSHSKTLVRTFCQPRKPTKTKPWTRSTHLTDPEKWTAFKAYNRQDVEAERANHYRMIPYDLPAHEWEMWHIDQEINDAGIPVNMRAVNGAIRIAATVTADRMDKLRAITGLENPNSGAQLLPWLRDHGYPYIDLKKGHVAKEIERVAKLAAQAATITPEQREHVISIGNGRMLEIAEDVDYHRVLEMRSEISKSSVKKYLAIKKGVDEDGNLRHCFQFAAAGRTWRWGGRRYQPQNLAHPWGAIADQLDEAVLDIETMTAVELELLWGEPMSVLSSCVRPVVQAPPGFLLVDADLNAIENRVLGWLADDEKILDVFRNKRDPYIDFATYMFGQPYAELWHEYKELKDKRKRTIAKPGVLGCGYMLSAGKEFENAKTGEIEATGLLGYAWKMNVKLTPEEAEKSVAVWRSTFKDAVQFWWDIDRAAKECMKSGFPQRVGFVRFDRKGPFLRMILPSGRALHYCRPKIEMKKAPWGDMKPTLTYEGLDDKNQWVRVGTHPGKLTENADQAISRDLLAHGIRLARRECGLDIRLHVHDQGIALVPEDEADEALKVLRECMEETPSWAPGLPLGTAGFTSRIFVKD